MSEDEEQMVHVNSKETMSREDAYALVNELGQELNVFLSERMEDDKYKGSLIVAVSAIATLLSSTICTQVDTPDKAVAAASQVTDHMMKVIHRNILAGYWDKPEKDKLQ